MRILRHHSRDASTVVILNILRGNFGIELLCWDLSAISYLANCGVSFQIANGHKKFQGKTLLWSPSKQFARARYEYPEELFSFAYINEEAGNKIIPSSSEVQFLENKAFMHCRFAELGIKTPATQIFSSVDGARNTTLSFPMLLKGARSSGSMDVVKIQSHEHLVDFVSETNFVQIHGCIILQELLNIRRDLRVTFVGKEIPLAYWRINQGTEWRPTSTSRGSEVLFHSIPAEWKEHIILQFEKLSCAMGAFDVAWRDDDLSTEPLFLEFSSRFSPNPPFKNSKLNAEYGAHKTKLFGKDVFWRNQTEMIFALNQDYLRLTVGEIDAGK